MPTPQIAYNGDPTYAGQAQAFVDHLIANPAVMARALDIIVEPTVERLVNYAGTPEQIPERVLALQAAWRFLEEGGVNAGKFRFDRPTDTYISKDTKLKDLMTRHRATGDKPDRQAELTRQIRARRLSIFAARLALSNKQAAARTAAPGTRAA